MTAATVTSKGQITIPADIRSAHGLEPGHKLIFFTGSMEASASGSASLR